MKKLTRKQYLQGNHDNLLGTILGFKRGRRYNNEFSQFNFFSFFLYFDHTTGRIERFLVNIGAYSKTKIEFKPEIKF